MFFPSQSLNEDEHNSEQRSALPASHLQGFFSLLIQLFSQAYP